MRRLRLTLEYDGSDFRGWQSQRDGSRTVQGALTAALAALPGEHGAAHAAGRTDAGVHALAMVVHVDTDTPVPDERLRLALNAHLPPDVAVVDLASTDASFEAQFSCRYRRYLYRMRLVRDRPRGVVLDRRRVLMVHRRWDVAAMRAATRHLRGRHDFSSFATQETRSRVRTLHLCELREELGELRLHLAGDGFLRGMVRAVAGTLAWVGQGHLGPDEVKEVLAARDRRRAGQNLPPHALYFVEAGYEAWDRARSDARLAERLDLPG